MTTYLLDILAQTDPIKAVNDIQGLGVAGVAILGVVLFLLALKSRLIVMGSELKGQEDASTRLLEQAKARLDDTIEQRDRLLDLALKTSEIAKDATSQAKQGRGRGGAGI